MVRTLKLTIEYDGTNYVGWQIQKNGISIQELIQTALQKITAEKGNLLGASRTDSGVHALAQVATYQTESSISGEGLMKAANSLLPNDICVKKIEEVADHFHPIKSAKSKTYTYVILQSPVHAPLLLHRVWHIRKPLDLRAMRKALTYFVGKHDFRSFMAQGSSVKTTTRRLTKASLRVIKTYPHAPLLQLTFQGEGFLRHQIRNMVGTLVEVGEGKRTPDSIKVILKKRDRKSVGRCAPACGLYLVKIKY
ncbi:MAG: tRNA pseudouridine(38-40) synthase TruA [Deltaproteobacteria bacterium RIFCSPLOWO2_02_FULL_44_10]|nr:MAG: tRNA pseudouridine(38-40) synthase TruA [Deltaproteobacteria bacterium RIFCSPHIGHO2_02_FULL_44_16]OGQ47047.1 MAG: tRNA pseudouridine(38-40) synthase TruA [Deltaproteobacteria bacterium RIFCSPLOWO2_02_FULL_44_10]